MHFPTSFYSLCFLTLSTLLSGCASTSFATEPALSAQALSGKRLFDHICSSCHSTLPDIVIVGPSLSKISEKAASRVEGLQAEDYLRQSILDPGAYTVAGYNDVMPRNLGQVLDNEQIDALIAYLMTLD